MTKLIAMSTTARLSPAEIASHTSDRLRIEVIDFLVTYVVSNLAPPEMFKGGFRPVDILRLMRDDRRENQRWAEQLELPNDATISEIVGALSGRLKIALDPKAATLDDVVALERAAINRR